MKILRDDFVPANTGWGAAMKNGQVLRLTAKTIIDFVCLNSANPNERFDQAQTKRHNSTLWISTGDALVSKLGNPMMTIVEDQFAPARHDLQYGMCSGPRYARAKAEGRLNQYHHGDDIPIPDHGCWENLQSALVGPYGVRPEDVPSPLNLFQHVEIDTRTGAIQHTPVRPETPVHVELRAEMDVIVAASACPDMAAPNFGQPIRAMIYEPES